MAKKLIAYGLGWLAILAAALVLWAQLHFIRVFDENQLLLEIEANQIKAEHAYINIAYKPGCPCNAFAMNHLEYLVDYYGSKIPLAFLLNQNHSDQNDVEYLRSRFNLEEHQVKPVSPENHPWIVSSLSAIIFNRDRSLAYLGPISAGIACSTETSFVDSILQNLLDERQVFAQLNGWAEGCYCNW